MKSSNLNVEVVNGNNTERATFAVRGKFDGATIAVSEMEAIRLGVAMLYWNLGDLDSDCKFGQAQFEVCGFNVSIEWNGRKFNTPSRFVDAFKSRFAKSVSFEDVGTFSDIA